ncbi:MAG: hypothetical protein LBI35_06260, partial [Burkholderiales bacterium]|nr:hypothetical protein [Burkholderiales bacterium]
QRIIIGTQQRDGWVRVVLAEQTLLEALRRLDIERAFSEAELIDPTADAWHWCVSPEGRGFVRRDCNNGGSAFALDLPSAAANHKTLLPELALALSAEIALPKTLHVHAALSSEILSSWQQANPACRLTVEPPWRWAQIEPALFAQATELLPQVEPTTPSRIPGNGWRTAALLLGIALALHVTATVAVWSSSLWQHWQVSRGWQALANEAGLPAKKNTATIPAQWSRAYADARHRAGLTAPDDALPLLARTTPLLRTLPSGALRNATYADHAWTLEFTPLDTATQKALETSLRRIGLQPMSGSTATGYRLRIQTQEKTP